MSGTQFFGLKYPFTNNDAENYYVDANRTIKDKVRSIIMHVIFTPKNQRIRQPQFGTDLIKYIFEPNDASSWDGVKNEIQTALDAYVPNVTIDNIDVLQSEDDGTIIYVRIDYTVKKGNSFETDSIYTRL